MKNLETSMRGAAAFAVTFLLVAGATAVAANWPQFRGPHFDGSTDEKGLPAKIGPSDNVSWTVDMPGRGAGTPAVWDDRVFVSSEDKATGEIVALCLDARTGAQLWRRTCGRMRKDRRGNGTASPSPVSDGRAVYFMFGSGGLVAYDFAGQRLWARELEKEFGVFMIQYRYSSSPLLYDGRLYVPVMQSEEPNAYSLGGPDVARSGPLESFILAIDAKTGRDVWKTVRPSDATGESRESYSTPTPYTHGGRTEILFAAAEFATGHDARTGRELWRWEFTPHRRKHCKWSASCVVARDDLVYVVRPKRGGMYALKGGASGHVGDEILAWRYDRYTPYVSSPLLYRGRLYVVQGDNKLVSCLDPRTGEVKWRERPGFKGVIRSSPIGADGKIYLISQNGEVAVMAAGDTFRVLCKADVGGAPCQASVVAASGRVYIRTADKLHCFASTGGGRRVSASPSFARVR